MATDRIERRPEEAPKSSSHAEERKASAEEKGRGRFPLQVVSYGDEATVKYAAVWVRYRIDE